MFTTIAWGIVSGAGALLAGRNCTISSGGAGQYTITIADAVQVDNNEMSIILTPHQNDRAMYLNVAGSTDTAKDVRAQTLAAVAANCQFTFEIRKLNNI